MAAVLDPRIKKELIPETLNSEKNLDEARSHFTRNYASNQFASSANGYGAVDAEEVDMVSLAEEIAQKRRCVSMNTAMDELSQYLLEHPAPIATDVLDWWKANSARYPKLLVMARDNLAVQGTSVDPDELFSSKDDGIHKQQFCLPCSSVQAIMCINSWVEAGYKFKFRSTEIDLERLVGSSATASEFINLISSESNEVCSREDKRTIAPEHILKALEVLGFGVYIEEVYAAYKQHKLDTLVV